VAIADEAGELLALTSAPAGEDATTPAVAIANVAAVTIDRFMTDPATSWQAASCEKVSLTSLAQPAP
jgi:hypothetical protein